VPFNAKSFLGCWPRTQNKVSDFLWQTFASLLKTRIDFSENFPKQSSDLEEESYEIAKSFGRF
jgi:hypothetical protein